MANSKIPTVQLTDTFNTQRNRFNSLVDSVGDVSTLTTTSKNVTGAILELDAELGTITAGAMGTTASTVSTAIGEIDGRLDSINTTQLLSPRMTLSDSSATNIVRGNLQVDTNLSVYGDLTFENSLTVEDSAYITGTLALGSNLNVAGNTTVGGDTTFANTITVQDSAYVTGTFTSGNLNSGNLILDNDLTVHGIANLDSTNVVGQLDVSGSITATNFTVSGAFTTAGATRAANSFSVVNDGVTVTNTNRAGLAVDRPSLDSAVIQWNELGDFWEIGTNQTDGGSSSDLKRVARQNDSAVFTNLMQSGTGATRIPAGTTAQRPSSEQGQIRYNTTNASFEGYSGSAWSGLGGLIDVDGDTKVLAERSAGNDSDTLTFFTAGVERLRINDSGSTFATNISGAGLTLSGNITMAGARTVDGYDVSSLGSKLAGIETGATADQTAAQIKTAYEGNANTEAFTTALKSKLNGIANSANNFTYTLPTAAAGTKGGVKVGNGLSISSEVLSHSATSSQTSSNNSGRTYIQDITLDTYGHVTGLSTASESVVNTDTNTTYSAGNDLDLSGTTFNIEPTLNFVTAITPASNEDLTLKTDASTSGGGVQANGNINIDAGGRRVRMKGDGATNTATNSRLDFDLEATEQTITSTNNLILETATGGNSIFLLPTGANAGSAAHVYMGPSGNRLDFDLGLTQQTIVSSDNLVLSSAVDIFLIPTGDDVIMQGTTANEQIKFTLGQTTQEIVASDDLVIGATGGDLTLYTTTSGDVDLNPASGKIGLFDNGNERAGFDVNTADTLKIYTGSNFGTLNSTFSGDDLTVQGDVNSVSDIRTKENVATVEGGLDLVSQLRGVWYNKIGHDDRKVGVIAQEVEEVLPEVVNTDGDGMKSVDYGKMVGVLIEAIKELKQEIEELKG